MSSARRNRRDKKNADPPRQNAPLRPVPDPEPEPPQPADPERMLSELAENGAALLEADTPLEAEIVASMLLASRPVPEPEFLAALAEQIVPALASTEQPEMLALLLGLGAVAPDPAGSAAAAAAEQLAAAGVPEPAWAPEAKTPIVAGRCWELAHPLGIATVLAGTFHRGEHSHAILVTVDPTDCWAAEEAGLLDGEELDDALAELAELAGESAGEGVALRRHELDPGRFRWELEAAMDARAVHGAQDGSTVVEVPEDPEEFEDPADLAELDEETGDEDEGPDYAALVPLLRARVAALPEPAEPKPPHGAWGVGNPLQALQGMLGGTPFGPAAFEELPRQRDDSDGPAPIYRMRVDIRGAKPPIWRRLELPADTRLDQLHEVLQSAFDGDGGHMHVFETPYGDFGMPDTELEHSDESEVTVEQVLPAERDKIRYTYDFGDDWVHDIRLEKVAPRAEGTKYPRCTGGRRAAPPEDCGGIYGYEVLLETLADPQDPEHAEMLDWLGLQSAAQFDPAAFDKDRVTGRLPRLR